MNLDHRHARGDDGVPERNAGVGEPARVHQHALRATARPVEGVDEDPFMVGLEALELAAELRR